MELGADSTPVEGRPPGRRDFLKAMAGLGAGALLASPDLLRGVERQALPTRPVPATGEELPVVGFGSTKAVLESPEEGIDPIVDVIRVLLEQGGRVVDTSVRTPEIDRVFGRALEESGLRDQIFLATKVNTRAEEEGLAQMRQNLDLLGRGEPLDLLQVESLRGLEAHWPRVLEWKDEGRTRYAGVTVSQRGNHAPLEDFMRRERPDFVHLNYSLMEPQAEEVLLPLARERGMAVIVNRPFMNGEWFGMVAGRDLPEWTRDFGCETWAQFSLKYILANPAVTCVLTETTNPEHMEENAAAAFGRLPDDGELERMREVVASF